MGHGLNASGIRTKRRNPILPVSWWILFIVCSAVISGFLFGYCCGAISGVLLIISPRMQLSDHWQELIVSGTGGAAALSTICSGYLVERLGRKRMLLISSVFYVAGSAVMAAAINKEQLFAGRIIVGIAVGITSCVIPVYIAEITPPRVRGQMLVSFQMMITLGFFCAALFNAAFSYVDDDEINWRLMLGVGAVPPVLQMLFLIYVPESPRWLAIHAHKQKAEKVMMMLNDESNRSRISAQMDVKQMVDDYLKMKTEIRRKASSSVLLNMLKSRTTRKALIIGCVIQMIQQLSGINTVMYYSATIIQSSGIRSRTASMWMISIAYGVNFFSTLIGMYLIDRLGRRLLFLYSTAGVMLSCFLMGVGFTLISNSSASGQYKEYNELFSLNDSAAFADSCAGLGCDACSYRPECGFCFLKGEDMNLFGACVSVDLNNSGEVIPPFALYGRCAQNRTESDGHDMRAMIHSNAVFDTTHCITEYSWIPIVAMVIYLCSFAVGLGPIPWIVNAEIYPNWARAIGSAVSSFANWSFNIIISLTFLTLNKAISRQGSFFLYGGICTIGFAFVYVVFPETNGMRVEEIEEVFKSSWVYAKLWCKKGSVNSMVIHPEKNQNSLHTIKIG